MLRKILLLILVNTSVAVTSQNYLGISKVITGFLDTVNINQSVSYKIYIKNYGPAVFSGFFRVNTWADSTTAGNNYHFSRLDTLFNPVTINVGDSLLFNTGDTYDLATYRVTGNGVVIWPKTFNPNWQTKDSAFHSVYVRGLVGIKEYNLHEKLVKLYPNPVLTELNLSYDHTVIQIEDVRILNIIGESVKEFTRRETDWLDLSELGEGIYTLELNTNKGRIYKRFIKQ